MLFSHLNVRGVRINVTIMQRHSIRWIIRPKAGRSHRRRRSPPRHHPGQERPGQSLRRENRRSHLAGPLEMPRPFCRKRPNAMPSTWPLCHPWRPVLGPSGPVHGAFGARPIRGRRPAASCGRRPVLFLYF